MWPFSKEEEKEEKKVYITGKEMEINPPSKSPKSIKRNDKRIEAITYAMSKEKCVGEAKESFEKELSRRKALQTYWGSF